MHASHDILAYAFLTLLALLPAILCLRSYLSKRYSFTLWCLWVVAMYLTKIQWRGRMPRRLPLEKGQGAVLVCNHRSSIDPFFIQVLEDKVMHWLVAKEYLQHPVFGWFLRTCEVIPVNRGGVDNAATRLAIENARRGAVVAMFPEGRINVTDKLMLPGRPGAVLVAIKAQVPLVPCYLEGSPYRGTPWSPLLMRANTRLKVGEPIDVAPYAGREREPQVVRELLLRAMREIARLAGHEDFQPQVAGRKWRDPTEEEGGAGGEAGENEAGENKDRRAASS